MLQTVHNLDLKRRSYGRLKTNCAQPKRKFFDFAATPPFRRVFRSCKTTLWHMSATSQHLYTHFVAVKWAAKIALRCENAPSFKNGLRNSHFVEKWFPNFQMAMKWTPSSKMATKMLQALKWVVKFPFGCEMFSQPHSYPLPNPPFAAKMAFRLWNDFPSFQMATKWPPSFKMATKLFPNFKMGCENVSLLFHELRKCFSFFSLAAKWSLSYEMTSRL